MTLHRRIRQCHKILGVVVFVQLFLWMLSGLYMTLVPIDKVRGEHLVEHPLSGTIKQDNLLSPTVLLSRFDNVTSIELFNRLNTPAYRVNANGTQWLIDAITGQALPNLNKQAALNIANMAYTGSINTEKAQLIHNINQAPEARGRALPVWQVQFDDWLSTAIYVSPRSGEIVAVRSHLWRIFDFLWMLHIMDYEDREDFNNPLVIFMATLGLFLVLSGVLMITKVIKKGGVSLLLK